MKTGILIYCVAIILFINCAHVPGNGKEQSGVLSQNKKDSTAASAPAGELQEPIPQPTANQPVMENKATPAGKDTIESTPHPESNITGENKAEAVTDNIQSNLSPGTDENINNPAAQQKTMLFNMKEAIAQVTAYFHKPEFPIVNKGELLFITHDLNADEILEILVPGIESEKPANANFEYISSFSRLFDTEKTEVKFNLYIFHYTEEGYVIYKKISLGFNQVFKSLIKLYGNSKTNDPVIIAATFQTGEGTLHKWILFKKPELKPISIFQFEETLFKQAVIKDIDDDGTIDVVIQEKSIEERIGYETYLSWMKWNGRAFVEYKNTNVVRNLNAFLIKIKELLIKGDVNKLLSFAIDPNILKTAVKKGLSGNEILEKFLGISGIAGENNRFMLSGTINNIIFPDILDNPFYLDNNKGYYFPLTYRLVFQNDISIIAETFLYMKKNPFGDRQFTLLPANGDQNEF